MKRFYELWTRKEAYLKAIGTGITENLRTEVILKTKHGPVSFEDGIIQKVFQFQSLLFGEDYLVTMAVAAGSGYLNTFFVRNVETYTSVITEA